MKAWLGRLRVAALLAGLAWALWGFGREVRVAVMVAKNYGQPTEPSLWRLTTPAARRLVGIGGQVAEELERRAPGERQRVALSAPRLVESERLFVRLWLAHTAPRHDWFELPADARLRDGDYVLHLGLGVPEGFVPGETLRRVLRIPDGAGLFRVMTRREKR